MLTRKSFIGPWAGLTVPWTDDDRFDEATYRANVAKCCQAGIPGVYSGGTTGEFYAMEFDEFKQVAAATVETCHDNHTPAMIGCTSTYTLGAIRRAKYAAKIGADAIQIALPFWMEVDEKQIVPFFQEVSAASNAIPMSIYETTRAKQILTLDHHRQIHETVPNYLMVKSNAQTLGVTQKGCQAISEFVNVFVDESLWSQLGPHGACGSCSAMVYWNPRIILSMWTALKEKNWDAVGHWREKIEALHQFLFEQFEPKGFTDTAFDRLGAAASGFLNSNLRSRGPYPSATEQDIAVLRNWCEDHFPEMLVLTEG